MVDAVTTTGVPVSGEPIVLHQMLHGYAEGHRLLETSLEIPDTLSRLLLRLSDLSGSNINNGFEEYLSGYPLAPLNAYALAKTWYAPEMPRPGCVWTHTIVVPSVAMSGFVSLDSLRELFKRPTERSARSAYGKPLLLASVPPPQRAHRSEPDILQNVLSIHYGKDGIPVLLAANDSKEFEEMVFALWSQKWPDLRMKFTFCTGSLSARFLDRQTFDLQCVPLASTRSIYRDILDARAIEPVVANATPLEFCPWAAEAATDAWSVMGGALRAFMWQVSDGNNRRSDFVSLISIFDALKKSIEFGELITLVAGLFPDAQAGSRLKSILFGEPRELIWYSAPKENEALCTIGTTAAYESLDGELLSLRKRSERLCIENPDDASWLMGELFHSTLNPLGEEILAGIISGMGPETARRLTYKQLHFLPALFQAKPSLASSPQLWTAAGDRRRELLEAVGTHSDLSSTLIAEIVSALFESGSDFLMRRAFDLWGKDGVLAALDWISNNQGAMSDTCRDALREHFSFVMEWNQSKSSDTFGAMFANIQIVAPFVSRMSSCDSSVWLRSYDRMKGQGKESERNYCFAFFLALGLNGAQPSPIALIAASFERLHEAARAELISDSAWVIVEPYVPELSWLSNWDKCERLRRGLIAAFVKYQWSASELKNIIKDKQLLHDLVRSARRVDGGEGFSREISAFA